MSSSVSSKVVVIGKGRFGNATAQGFRDGFVENEDGFRTKCDVVQVSATKFTSLSVDEMAAELQNTVFVAYCGTMLSDYSGRMALAIKEADMKSSGPTIEFIDFSNPDPTLEKADVTGAVDLWIALNGGKGKDEEVTKNQGSVFKVWKITEVGSVDVSGITGNTGKFISYCVYSIVFRLRVRILNKTYLYVTLLSADGLVYGSHPGQIPGIIIPNLTLKSAGANATLVEETRTRIMERASIDCW